MKSTGGFKPQTELTFSSVGLLLKELHQALKVDDNPTFILDLSLAGRCDSAGLALLLEARKLCQRANKDFALIGVSLETQALLEFCGVSHILAAKGSEEQMYGNQ